MYSVPVKQKPEEEKEATFFQTDTIYKMGTHFIVLVSVNLIH